VEVAYTEDKPMLDEGPFLKEERSLLNAIARNLAIFLEAKQVEEQRRRLQEQLRHADRLATIGQLAAGVTHEINEPLAGILGLAQLIANDPDLPEQAQRDNQRIIDSALYAREIVRKLMLFARQTPPSFTSIDVNEVVREGLFFLENRCAKEGIRLRRSLEESLPAVQGDPGQLTQALVNLVVNSIHATPQGGLIEVSTRRNDGQIVLAVSDTGSGMAEEILTQVFVPFFTTKDIDKGTGLGLAVVSGIVEAHHGTIEVSSEVGRGTLFTIRLPPASAGDELDP
jgi:signal transduction histidine kinase